MQVSALQDDTLDLLCWRHLGTTAGVVETALALNPGIAGIGALLPAGYLVSLPDAAPAVPATPMINLWD